jgi:hypothetical protein
VVDALSDGTADHHRGAPCGEGKSKERTEILSGEGSGCIEPLDIGLEPFIQDGTTVEHVQPLVRVSCSNKGNARNIDPVADGRYRDVGDQLFTTV